AALPSFALAAELRIEEADPFDHAAVKRHIASERVTTPAVHTERLVPVILIAQEPRDLRARYDPAWKLDRGIQMDPAADRVGIGPRECLVQRGEPARADVNIIV